MPMFDCIYPTTRPGANGYSKTTVKVAGRWKTVQAHRHVYAEANGAIPFGMVVMHKCDNRRCINIEHLELGTHADNSADMVAKNRSAKGSRHGCAVLCEEDVMRVKDMLVIGVFHKDIAKSFGVAQSTIGAISRRKNWAWL